MPSLITLFLKLCIFDIIREPWVTTEIGQCNEVFYTDGIHLSPRGTAMLVSNWKRSLYPDQPRGRSNITNRDTRQYRQDGNR